MPVEIKKAKKPVVKDKKPKKKKLEDNKPKKIELKDFKPEHQKFILEYIRTGNATKSYMNVYPKSQYDAASVSSFQLLRNPNIKEYIQCYYDDLWSSRKNEISRTFDNLLKIANADITDVVDYEGDRMEVRPFNQSNTFLIAEIKEVIIETANGTNINKSVKLKDSTKAISELIRVLGMITDKVEHSGEVIIIPAVRPVKDKEEVEEDE